MRHYLDTNVLVKILCGGTDELPRSVRGLLEDYSSILLASSVCAKELIHLVQADRIRLPAGGARPAREILRLLELAGVEVVPVTHAHLRTMAEILPRNGHSDPDDRLIIAQAVSDRIPLVSMDRKFPAYRQDGLELVEAFR